MPLFEHVTDEVVLMQSLHHDNDASLQLVVEAAEKCIVEPCMRCFSGCFRKNIVGFLRVVEHDNVRAASR